MSRPTRNATMTKYGKGSIARLQCDQCGNMVASITIKLFCGLIGHGELTASSIMRTLPTVPALTTRSSWDLFSICT